MTTPNAPEQWTGDEPQTVRLHLDPALTERRQESMQILRWFIGVTHQYSVPPYKVWLREHVQSGPLRDDGTYPGHLQHRCIGEGWIVRAPILPEVGPNSAGRGPVVVLGNLLLIQTTVAPGFLETTEWRMQEGQSMYNYPDDLLQNAEAASAAIVQGLDAYHRWANPSGAF